PGAGLRCKYSFFISGKMPVTTAHARQRRTLRLRLVLVAGICSIVDVQPRHLVETHYPANRMLPHIVLPPLLKPDVLVVIEQRPDRRDAHIKAVRNLALPAQGIHANPVPPPPAFQRDA